MTDYVWYPVTGNGTSVATAYQWNNAQANWNTGSWIVGDALIFGCSVLPAILRVSRNSWSFTRSSLITLYCQPSEDG